MSGMLPGERCNLDHMGEARSLIDQLVHDGRSEGGIKQEVIQDGDGREFKVGRGRRIHEVPLKYGDERSGAVTLLHSFCDTARHGSLVRYNLEAMAFAAEIV